MKGNVIFNISKKTVIVHTIPAFNVKNFIHVNSENAYEDHPQRAFETIAPIDKSSILAIGQNDCFAEIFEIGKLLEYYILPERGKRRINKIILKCCYCKLYISNPELIKN